MGLAWTLLKTGGILLGVGFLLSVVAEPLGTVLGQVGIVLLVGGVALHILNVALSAVVGTTGSSARQRTRSAAETRSASIECSRRPHGHCSRPGEEMDADATGEEQLDLSADTIDDYRR